MSEVRDLYRAVRTRGRSASRPGKLATEGEEAVRKLVIDVLERNVLQKGISPEDTHALMEAANSRAIVEIYRRVVQASHTP